MNKEEIINKLKELNIEKDKFIILFGSALVFHGLRDETNDIDLEVSKSVFLEYEKKSPKCINDQGITYLNYNNIDIGYVSYDVIDFVEIDGFKVQSLESILEYKQKLNRKKDQKDIKNIDMYLCTLNNRRYENNLRNKGINIIAGVDEVGRGPLIGPVVSCAIILPNDFYLEGITDSKKLSEKKRNYYYEIIKENAIAIGLGIIDNHKIDEVNIYEATKMAMKSAINNLSIKPEHILIDAMPLDIDINTTSIIKGDLKSFTISCASIIAKVERDRMMEELDKVSPVYNLSKNKGYPTKDHIEAIKKYGIIKEHRKTYGPVKEYINTIDKK